jgi:hypothetical protein
MVKIQALCVDARDPLALARFWSEVLGWRITAEEDDEVVLEPPAGSRSWPRRVAVTSTP